ncbi:MAG: hypothetical protein KGZ59_06395 [Chitinophagaceae bacterium]|nr:hypothetical protein [Chitinophagaceae bacterium]
MQPKTATAVEVVTASEAAKIIGCSRGYIDTLRLKGILKPVRKKDLRLYFKKSNVEAAIPLLRKNQKKDEKA